MLFLVVLCESRKMLMFVFSMAFCAFAITIYVFLIWNFSYWRKRNVRGPKPRPFFGTFPNLIGNKQHYADDINDIYKEFGATESFVGVFLMRTPQLMILEPSLVHDVFVGAFKHFLDNDVGKLVDPQKDPLIANNPFILRGQEWREQRALITPALSGVRIKTAYATMQRVCADLCAYVEQQVKLSGTDGINGKDLALRFTAENLCDCVLGIKAESFTATPLPVSENIKLLTEENTVFLIYAAMAGLCPSLVDYFRVKFFPRACECFFKSLICQAFRMRRLERCERNDFINHLLELQEKHGLSELALASHSMTFLIDGLDTTATTIAHCLLLLAREPVCQQRLRRELNTKPDLSFETINELPYLDACFHESLRIFPPGLWATKTCTEPYTFRNKNGDALRINVGETLLLPIYALHHDARYYAEPEEFKPERFMPTNGGVKKYRNMGVFLGFGDGPRTCLGMRLALVQAKAAIATIVRNFHVSVHPKTKTINRLDPKIFVAIQDGGVWLNFERLNVS